MMHQVNEGVQEVNEGVQETIVQYFKWEEFFLHLNTLILHIHSSTKNTNISLNDKW